MTGLRSRGVLQIDIIFLAKLSASILFPIDKNKLKVYLQNEQNGGIKSISRMLNIID